MSYLVLARKWRPQTFLDLVGQDHVRRTLENAIAQDRVAHAFLFTGVRGVGKTSSARILAKTLNCERGPTVSPCLKCPQCLDITAGNDMDVRELDGASNNGVEDVRRLQEELPYRPVRDRFKIYIVDEVHMLSAGAWNAFLKTLEEPPPHVKFIFATTEVHKVPITILSRCQRYDFRMISAQTIATRLRYVLGQEKVVADDAAINLIAREAAGSMRDAMSLLDQAIAWSSERLVGDEVARVLGVASRSVLHQLAVGLVGGQPEAALRIVAQLMENGYDLGQVSRDLLAVLRDLVVAKVCTEPGHLLDLSEEERRDTVELAKRTSSDDLVRLHQGFARSFDEIVRSPSPRAGLEMVLVRLARRPPLVPLDDLLGRLSELERRLGGGPASPPARPSPGGSRPSGGRPPPAQASGTTAAPLPSPAAPASVSAPGPQASATSIHAAHIVGATALAVPFAPAAPAAPVLASAPAASVEPTRAPPVALPQQRPANEGASNGQPRPGPPSPRSPAPEGASNVIRPVFPSARPAPSTAPASSPAPSVPLRPAPPPSSSPSLRTPAPPSAPQPSRPSFTPPGARPSFSPPAERPSFTPPGTRPSFSPPVERPSFTPSSAREPAPPSSRPPAVSRPPLSVGPTPTPRGPRQQPGALAHDPSKPLPGPLPGVDFSAWRRIVEQIRGTHPALASVLELASPRSIGPAGVTMGYPPNSFEAARVSEPRYAEPLAKALQAELGPEAKATVELNDRAYDELTLAKVLNAERWERREAARQRVSQHPLVRAIIEELGADLKDVKVSEN